jgi:diacylglycerol O-acyltransferase
VSPSRLTPFESILWRAGQDPTRRLTVGVLLVVDRSIEEKSLVAQVGEAIARAPRLRCRPDDPTSTHIRPEWVEDEDVDPEYHVRSIDIPAPGTLRQVLDLVTLLEAAPFDPDHSPWDLTLLQPLENGRAAVYVRAHHVLTDGVGGVRMLEVLFDHDSPEALTTPAPRVAHLSATATGAATPTASASASNGDGDRPPWWKGSVTIDLTRASQSVSTRIGAARDTRPLATLLRGVQRTLDMANSVSRQMVATGGPLSSLPTARSVVSHFDVLSVSHTREAAIALGGSRNDLLVSASATAFALYAERLGETCTKVRVAMPARRRRDGALGGNWFAPTRVEVPAATTHPDRQFGVIAERLAQARQEPALMITDVLASAISVLPNRLLHPALEAEANAVDLAVTTIPGMRGRPNLCGAAVQAAYPMGPRLGVPLNVTAFASGDRLDIGLSLDTSAITDPDAFRACIDEAFRRFTGQDIPAMAVE